MTAFDDDYDIRTFAAALSPESTDDQPRADAETAAWIRAEALGFHEAAPDDSAVGRTARRLVADGRTETGVHPREPREGALDAEGLPVATFESFVESLNVGGGRLIDAHLISGVTVQPTHRRRGILRRLMTDDLARAKSAGLAVAALTASEGSIYRRFGFGVGVRERTIEVDPRRAFGLLGDPEGAVELVSRDALDGLAPGVFARFHARTPGSIDRHEGSWNRLLGRERPDGTPDPAVRGAVHRDSAGTLDGYVSYRLEGENEAHTLVVLDLVAATDDAYLGLWQLLLSVDLVDRVRFAGASQSDPIGHALVNGRALRVTHDEDHVWFRILDTVAALQARPWAADGVVTIAVGDSLGHAAGTFRVTSEGGSATVKRAAVRRADIELDVATLGSLWLGGVDPVTLAAAGLVRERRKGAVQTVRAMIAPDRPVHSITHF